MLAVVLFWSCSENPDWSSGDEPNDDNYGLLNLSCFTLTDINAKAATYVYAVEVRNASDEVVFTTPNIANVTDGIKLIPGQYTVKATSGSLTVGASRTPCYTGSSDVTIEKGKKNNVTITTALNNVKVTVYIDETMDEFFESYELVVLNNDNGVLSFTNSENVGYFLNTGTLTWEFKINYVDGSSKTVTETIEDTKIKDNYILTFKLGEEQQSEVDTKVEVQDMEHKYEITISGTPPAHSLKSANGWAKFIEVEGVWTTAAMPDGLCFEYRVDGSNDWTVVTPTVDDGSKKITAKISGLTPLTKYYVRTSSTGEKSTPMECTTETILALENSTMDTWTQSGKNWYANNVADETFWGSGNEGVTSIFAGGKPSNTAPTDDAVSGKAARLESIKVSVVGMAAGNLFTGKFDMNMGKPLDSPSFSQPYTGRPTSLSFWYKYSPVGLNSSKTPNDIKGQTDKCIAYIILGTWSGQIKSSAIKGRNTEGAVAYGEFSTDATVSEYTKQTINIEYLDKTTRPTRIIIVVSSSLRGEEYIGGLGSTMFIDEFELGWD